VEARCATKAQRGSAATQARKSVPVLPKVQAVERQRLGIEQVTAKRAMDIDFVEGARMIAPSLLCAICG
jgi:hypothetical protein